MLSLPGGKARGETEVGVAAAGQAEERHRSGVQGGLCPVHHGQEAGHVRAVQSGSEGKDEEN